MTDWGCTFMELGRTDNPFTDMQQFIHDQMYPRFAGGFTARVAVLLALLACVFLISLLYLFVTIRDTRQKGRKVWLVRLVRRPAGRYVVANQYLFYPLLSIILSAVWIAYTAYCYDMFGPTQGNPRRLVYFLTLGWLPFFALLSITTFSTTSSANLASRGRNPDTHRLPPWATAILFFILVPVLIGIVLGTGIWTGTRWHRFASRWQEAYDYLGAEAKRFNGTVDPVAAQTASGLLMARCRAIPPFNHAQFATSMIYVVAAAVLIVLNLFSGIYLLSTLRQMDDRHLVVPRGTPLVAPLQPIPLSTGRVTTPADITAGKGRAVWEREGEASQLKLHRLRWDVVLFFMSVVPFCATFIGYEAWFGTRFVEITMDPGLLEFAILGMIWIYAFLSLLILGALTLKTLLTLRTANTRRAAEIASLASASDANLRRNRNGQHSGQRVRQFWTEGERDEYDDPEEESFGPPIREKADTWTVVGDSPRDEVHEKEVETV
ncbi:hypothetical protein JCM11251_006099 [Rhodosporidiobolus azoricus]